MIGTVAKAHTLGKAWHFKLEMFCSFCLQKCDTFNVRRSRWHAMKSVSLGPYAVLNPVRLLGEILSH